jgi:hypothetical protein
MLPAGRASEARRFNAAGFMLIPNVFPGPVDHRSRR